MPKTPRERLIKAASEQKTRKRFGFLERLFHGSQAAIPPEKNKGVRFSPQSD